MIPLSGRLGALRRSRIRVYSELAKATPGCISLTLGEPDFDTPEPIRAAAAAALQGGRTHYAPNGGIPALRQAIARREGCQAEQVIVTLGATEALYTALTGILSPGDEVVIPTPAFNLYESIVLAAGGVPKYLDLAATGFQITPAALGLAITPKTRAIVLNSPNNPTGKVLSRASLDAVKQAVVGKPIWIVEDAVYSGLCSGPRPQLWGDPELAEQVLLCQSFSKPYAMTGWRAGYLAGPGEAMERLLLLHAAVAACVPTFVQDACLAALETDVSVMAALFALRRKYGYRRLTGMGLACPVPAGAFYAFPDISPFGMDSETFCTRMIREAGVAAVPGSCFAGEGHIRISFTCGMETLEQGLNRMESFIGRLG